MIDLLRSLWSKFSSLPFGKRLFSFVIGIKIPYTGSIRPRVVEIGHGYAKVCMRDRRRVRNHLASIHALALANLGEFSGGLALHFAMPKDCRAILTNMSAEYLKKARGTIVARANIASHPITKNSQVVVDSELFNDSDELVALVKTTWLLGPSSQAKSLKN